MTSGGVAAAMAALCVMTSGGGAAAMAALGRAWRALLRARGVWGDAAGRRGVRALRRSPVRVLQPQSPRDSPQSPAEPPPQPPPPVVERGAAAPGLWYEKAAPGDRRLG